MTDFTTEEWRPVVGWDGLYEVSSHGRVRSLPRRVLVREERGAAISERKYKGKALKSSLANNGYYVVNLCLSGKRRTRLVHVLVAQAFVLQENPKDVFVNHKNTIKTDNSASNLEWCDCEENAGHYWHIKDGSVKELETIRTECLQMLEDGATAKAVSRAKGISVNTLRRWRKEKGILITGKRFDSQRVLVRKMLDEGLSVAKIVALSGVSRTSVYRIVRENRGPGGA